MYHTGQRGFIVHRLDNAATALDDIVRGKVTLLGCSDKVSVIEALEEIPFGHKIAVQKIFQGDPVTKYGVTIGTAVREIQPGEHVHLHNVKSNFDLRASTYDTATAESTDMEYRVY